jgi:hypothetical protein
LLNFFADCKDTGSLHFQPNFYGLHFTKNCEEQPSVFWKISFDQKAAAKISKYLTPNKLFCFLLHKKMPKALSIFLPPDRFSKSGRKDTGQSQLLPNHLKK